MTKNMTRRQIITAAVIGAVLLLLVGADFLVEHHPYFTIDGWPGFAAIYGVLAALAAIGLASAYGDVADRADDGEDGDG